MKKILMSIGLGMLMATATISLSTQAGTPVGPVKGQPHMKAALKALKKAESELQKAKHNKGGHRVKALSLVRDAIKEVQAGGQHAKEKKKEKKEKRKKGRK